MQKKSFYLVVTSSSHISPSLAMLENLLTLPWNSIQISIFNHCYNLMQCCITPCINCHPQS